MKIIKRIKNNLFYIRKLMEKNKISFIENNKEIPFFTGENLNDFNSFKKQAGNRKIFITHSGAFHADEVLAAAMIKFTSNFNQFAIVRTRNTEIIKQGDIVADVGGKFDPENFLFDHHQKEFTSYFEEKNKIKMSSAGLVYKYLGKDLLKNILNQKFEIFDDDLLEKVYWKLYENFIMCVDAVDNGINKYPQDIKPLYYDNTSFGSRIGRLNPSDAINTKWWIKFSFCCRSY
jgi:uncharacterized UPF0160 family protein